MKKDDFLNIISHGLKDFPEGELNDILYDYREHFDVGFESGKSEEEIINELGNPYDIVNQYRNGYLDPKVKASSKDSSNTNNKNTNYNNKANKSTSSTANTILTIIAVTLSLLIFGPFAASIVSLIAAVLIVVIVSSGGVAVAGIGILLGKVVTNTIGLFTFPAFILDFPDKVIVLMVIGSILLMIFTILLFYYCIKAFIVFMKRFLKWVGPRLRGEA